MSTLLKESGEHTRNTDIVDYYRQTIEDYQTWSHAGYMHFGYWRRWLNPFNRRSMLEAMNELVFDQLRLDRDEPMSIGDFGCGIGAVSIFGANRYSQHQWNAATVCPEQISYGKSRCSADLQKRVSYLQADYCNLPMQDESLDAVFFLESLCHAEHPIDALSEAVRVLKPGGRLVVVDGLMRKAPEKTSRLAKRVATIVADSWALGQFHHVPEFEDALDELNLKRLQSREIGWNIAPSVAHSPVLVAWHSMKLIATGKFDSWKRKHMIGCALGMLLGSFRWQFGYFVYTLEK